MRVETAVALATQVHFDQKDHGGRAYILHPLRVAAAVSAAGDLAVVVALLHDALEDGGAETLAHLRAGGLTDEELEALEALRHHPHEPYPAYIRRVAKVPVARIVKLADLADNLAPWRLEAVSEEVRARLVAKYGRAKAELESEAGQQITRGPAR